MAGNAKRGPGNICYIFKEKSYIIDNKPTTTEGRETISGDLESLQFAKCFNFDKKFYLVNPAPDF